MKLKNVLDLPQGKSYHSFEEGYLDFDNGILDFSTCEYEESNQLNEKQTKALFTSMLMHYMANGDTDLFEVSNV